MLKFNKAYEIREMMRRCVADNGLISSLFEDCPALKTISFSYDSEYDDNNYTNYSTLRAVNGHLVDPEGYEEKEEVSDSDLPRVDIKVLNACEELVGVIGSEFGFGEHEILREEYPAGKIVQNMREDEFTYLSSFLSGAKIKDSWFFKNNPKWACYYSLDHGKFSEEAEFKIFAKKGSMYHAYWYAFYHGRLPSSVESFFILSTERDDGDHQHLQAYSEKFLEKSSSAQ